MAGDLLQFAVLASVAVGCGVIGPFLVLNRMAMFANSLSHTILLGIALAFLIVGGSLITLPTLLIGALFASIASALFTRGLIGLFRLQEEASVGLVFTSMFALGISLVTLYMKNVHIGIEAVMGNADILSGSDLRLSFSLASFLVGTVLLFYRKLQIVSFDSNFAKTLHIFPTVWNFVLLFLTAALCIGAFRAIGVILVLAYLVGPYLTARIFSHRLKTLLILTPLLGVGASFLGVLISRLIFELFSLPLSTGGVVTVVIGLIYLFSKWVISIRIRSCERQLQS